MITLENAIKKTKTLKPENKVVGISETDDIFIFLLDNDDEGYVTVNKETGKIGNLWFWEYGKLSMNNKVRDLDHILTSVLGKVS